MKINLRKLRIQKKYTINQLATKAHVGVGTISRIENCEIKPTIVTICKLCVALNVSIDKMVEFREIYYEEEW